MVGPSVAHLAAALLQQPGPKASDPVETTLGGYAGTPNRRSRSRRASPWTPATRRGSACRSRTAPTAGKNFVLLADAIASVYILDVDRERQVFLVQHGSSTSDEALADLQAVLGSNRIERSPTPQPSVVAP